MKRRLILACIVTLSTMKVFASCGSSSCPIDLNALNKPAPGGFSADISYEYINQNQPRIGTRSAAVGELPAEHDEVRTSNRVTSLLLRYGAGDRWIFSATLPYIDRAHDHLADGITPEHWNLRGIGDITLQARRRVSKSFWVIGGVKLPAGATSLANSAGEKAEVPIQPGTGSVDEIVGFTYERGVNAATPVHGEMGNIARIPLFLTATYRRNGNAARGYRVGNEIQINTGTAYPITHSIEALLQLNGRSKARDVNPEAGGRDPFTGGKTLFVSPGVRWSADRAAFYALMQLPLYRDYNGLQLSAKRQLITGIQLRF